MLERQLIILTEQGGVKQKKHVVVLDLPVSDGL